VPDAGPRNHDPARPARHDAAHGERPIERDDVDREGHRDGVYAPTTREEQPGAGSQRVEAEEAAAAFAPRLRDGDGPPASAVVEPRLDPHPPTVAPETDAHDADTKAARVWSGPGRIRTRDTRVKSPLL
jgi:hypothetical protein